MKRRQLTFLKVLKSNLKCAFCKSKDCPVRYMPNRKKEELYHGTRYVTRCKKDEEEEFNRKLNRKLP